MKIENNQLIDELIHLVNTSTQKVQSFKKLELDQLNFKKEETTWSILECIEHLNLYGDFYLPEIEKRMNAGEKSNKKLIFKSGVLGNYFANSMKEKNGKIKKMKTFEDKNPIHSQLTVTTLDRFIKQQERLVELLNIARDINLTKTKNAITISKIIKLRLGDTFRFLIFHIERHVNQAERVLK